MRVIVFGASGIIGSEVVKAFSGDYEVIPAHRNSKDYSVDISDKESLKELFIKTGKVDGIVSAAGSARFAEINSLKDEDLEFSINNKLMGQVNIIREGMKNLNDEGFILVTTGVLARNPIEGSAAISMVNSGLEGFARAAANEAKENKRVNVISPPWIYETLEKMGKDPAGGVKSAIVAKTYLEVAKSDKNGEIIEI